MGEECEQRGGEREASGDRRLRRRVSAMLAAIGLGGALDLVLDRPARLTSFHVLFELGLLALSLGGAAYLWLGWRRAGDSLARTRRDLAARQAERDVWRERTQQILRGLGEAIDAQLRDWQLTVAERETALLLLKGYGHKEIAALQEKSERTVRQHAIAVYRKAGVAGRAELSAFFLEDLLLPPPEPERVPGAPEPGERRIAPASGATGGTSGT
ncbi:MAG: LuxR C-terminal-related transcriptional regulator [Myxococcota bacterium]